MGCAPQDSKNSSSPQIINSESSVNTTSLSLQKVFIEEAQIENIKSAKIECGSQSHGEPSKICVKICHVPPGNPQNKSEKVLPLSAIKAHLNHGSNHDAEKRDYLGACQQANSEDSTNSPSDTTDDGSNSTTNSDDPAVDTTTTTDASNDSSTSTTNPDPTQDTSTSTDETTAATDTSVVPLWCQPYVTIDTNCDGLVDSSGDPYL